MLANISRPDALSDRGLRALTGKIVAWTLENTKIQNVPASQQNRVDNLIRVDKAGDSCFEYRRNIVVVGEAGPVPLNLRNQCMYGLTLNPSDVGHAIIFLRTPEVRVSVTLIGLVLTSRRLRAMSLEADSFL